MEKRLLEIKPQRQLDRSRVAAENAVRPVERRQKVRSRDRVDLPDSRGANGLNVVR